MDTDDIDTKYMAFRCPVELARAMETAARKDYTNVSTVLRGAVAKEMRTRGLLTDAE